MGLDPDVATVFVQSHLPEHSQLCWIMECTVSIGELQRMVQFKEKSAKQSGFISAGLLTYPALQAADILLYDADEVPVGEDQRQHVEITRDIAIRFNHHFGDTFVVPKAVLPRAGARVMDLQEPTAKMSKSTASEAGVINLYDDPAAIVRKFKRAVTDSGSEVRFDRAEKPGVSNLLEIQSAATGRSPEDIAAGYTQYGPLKADTGEAVVELLRPVQERYRELMADPAELARLLAKGADKARAVAAKTLARAYDAVGCSPPADSLDRPAAGCLRCPPWLIRSSPARPRRRRGRRCHRLLRRLPPGPRGLDGRAPAGTGPAHVGHDLALGRADRHVRLDVRDLDRAMRKYTRDLYARLEEETGLSTGFKPVGFIEVATDADRLEEYRRVSAFNRYVRRRRPRDLGHRGGGAVPPGPHRRHPGRLLRAAGRPGQPGRRHAVAGQGRAAARRADRPGRAGDRLPHRSRRGRRRPHALRRRRGRGASSTAPACGRVSSASWPGSPSRSRRPSTTTSSPSRSRA